ncbi:hypothetical protein MBLNU457_7058t1 [Dothideomycetes sp. NU457]
MSDAGNDLNASALNLNSEEKRFYGQLFSSADTDRLGVVTGENAVKFFEKSRLAPNVLGEIWQIADSENRGLLTKPGFCVALRLIGHYQAGRDPTPELGFKPAPLPKFEGVTPPPPTAASPTTGGFPPNALQPQGTGGGVRIPPLTPDRIAQYSGLFERSGQQGGTLSGEAAKAIFERAGLPNEILGRIWTLSDKEQHGALDQTEFIVAMHLITSFKSKTMTALPTVLPAGLFEAASRRGPAPPARQPVPPAVGAIPRQFTGPQRTSSPLARAPYGTPPPQVAQTTGSNWLVTPPEKAKYDNFFANIDTGKLGYITGDQAVKFFSDSGLPEDTLAQIWDLADVRSEGQLNREEFAVAMYLIRQQRSGSAPLPAFLPAALMPPSMRNQPQSQQTTAPAFDNANNAGQMPKTAADDLFGLDSPPRPTPAVPVLQPQNTGSTVARSDPFAGSKPSSPTSPARAQFQPPPQTGTSMFRPFQPSSAFGASLASQNTGGSQGPAPTAQQQPQQPPQQQQPPPPQQQPPQQQNRSVQPSSAMDDLLGETEEDQSRKLTEEQTELANISSQVGDLRTQMQEVQSKKSNTERDLAAATAQKQELQQRLAQFRAQYQQEVQAVKTLEQQVATSRTDTQKLQQELAMLEGTREDLQNQHKQVSQQLEDMQTQHKQAAQQLETDQKENATLKERINSVNTEIAQLKPQIEKMKSDARQQKGMIAINKKQLSTNEAERDRHQSEMSDLSKAAAEQEQARAREAAEQEQARNLAAQQASEARSAVVSPTPSMGSRNPFFRGGPERVSSPGVQSPGGFMASAPSPSAFDSVFGPSKATSRTETPPPTSFSNREVPSAPASHFSSSERPTPTGTPAPGMREPSQGEAPAPPESRQFTPGMLPLRPPPSRGDSIASSTRAIPSHTNYGGSETPVMSHTQSDVHDSSSTLGADEARDSSHHVLDGALGAGAGAAAGLALGGAGAAALHEHHESEERPKPATQDSTTALGEAMPGAFPEESTPQPETTRETTTAGPSGLANATSGDDFDSAFAGFGDQQASSTKPSNEDAFGPGSSRQAANNEDFYPMTQAEESDSEDEHGFDDNFGSSASHGNGAPMAAVTSGEHREHAQPETTQVVESSGQTSEQPPPPSEDAVRSPPTYGEAAPFGADLDGHHERSTSNNQPPEFEGLLPAREDPTTSPLPHSVPQYGPEQSVQSPSYGPEQPLQSPREQSLLPPGHTPNTSSVTSQSFHDAASRPQSAWTDVHEVAPQPEASTAKKSAFDDFDDFDNLTEAQTGDDKGFDFGGNHEESEFNPTFDSPSASTIGGFGSTQQTPVQRSAAPASNGFHGFGNNGSAIHTTQPTPFANTASSPQASSHDWDAIFSGLDAPPNIEPGFGSSAGKQDAFDVPTPKAASPVQNKAPPVPARSTQPAAPQLSRAMTTEHDDPILKSLTGMGYSRDKALDALEKYDYDINRAADYLSSQ